MQFTDEQIEAASDAIYDAIISNPRNPNSARVDSIGPDETIYAYLARLALQAIPEPGTQARVRILVGTKKGDEYSAKRHADGGWSVDVGGGYPRQYYGDHEVERVEDAAAALLGSRWRLRGWLDAPVLTVEEVILSVNRKLSVRFSEATFDGRCETMLWAVADLDLAFVRQ